MNGIGLIADAWNRLKRQPREVATYVGLITLIALALRVVQLAIMVYTPEEGDAPWLALVRIASDLSATATTAMVQAVGFALLGKALDHPIWKCHDHLDALRRFFPPWFIINLLVLTVHRLQLRAAEAGNEDVVALLELFMLSAFLLAIPVGASIMHFGRLDWNRLGEALTPLLRLYPMTLGVLLLGFGQYILFQGGGLALHSVNDNGLGLVALDAALALLDCLAFTATWRICITYREMPHNYDDDFDF